MLNLTVSQRTELKARAHALKPIVIIGSAGLTEAVLSEIERSLKSHDLLKLRALSDDRTVRNAMLQEICGAVNASAVQHIGKTLVIWRPIENLTAVTLKGKNGKPLTKKQLGEKRGTTI